MKTIVILLASLLIMNSCNLDGLNQESKNQEKYELLEIEKNEVLETIYFYEYKLSELNDRRYRGLISYDEKNEIKIEFDVLKDEFDSYKNKLNPDDYYELLSYAENMFLNGSEAEKEFISNRFNEIGVALIIHFDGLYFNNKIERVEYNKLYDYTNHLSNLIIWH